jgi:hypothetical protein
MHLLYYIIAIVIGSALGFFYFVLYWTRFSRRNRPDGPDKKDPSIFSITGVVLYFSVVGLSGIYALLAIHWSFVVAALLALAFTRYVLTARYIPGVNDASEAQ